MELTDVIKLNNRAQNEIQYLLCEYIKKELTEDVKQRIHALQYAYAVLSDEEDKFRKLNNI